MKHRTAVFGVVAAGIVTTQAVMPVITFAAGTQAPEIQYAKTTITMAGHLTLNPEHIVCNDP